MFGGKYDWSFQTKKIYTRNNDPGLLLLFALQVSDPIPIIFVMTFRRRRGSFFLSLLCTLVCFDVCDDGMMFADVPTQ